MGIWHLPAERAKNGDAIDIPLPPPAVEWLRELHSFSGNSKWVPPCPEDAAPHDPPHPRKHSTRSAGGDPIVAERCLNHRIKGVEGIYNRHQYFDERWAGLALWADLLVALERGEDYNVVSIANRK